MIVTDPSRSRIKRALSMLRTIGTQRDGTLVRSNGLEPFQAQQLLLILNPLPRRARKGRK